MKRSLRGLQGTDTSLTSPLISHISLTMSAKSDRLSRSRIIQSQWVRVRTISFIALSRGFRLSRRLPPCWNGRTPARTMQYEQNPNLPVIFMKPGNDGLARVSSKPSSSHEALPRLGIAAV